MRIPGLKYYLELRQQRKPTGDVVPTWFVMFDDGTYRLASAIEAELWERLVAHDGVQMGSDPKASVREPVRTEEEKKAAEEHAGKLDEGKRPAVVPPVRRGGGGRYA